MTKSNRSVRHAHPDRMREFYASAGQLASNRRALLIEYAIAVVLVDIDEVFASRKCH